MAYFPYTEKIDFPFVSKENHFEGTHHYTMNSTIKNVGLKIIYSMQSNFILLKTYSILECHFFVVVFLFTISLIYINVSICSLMLTELWKIFLAADSLYSESYIFWTCQV